MPWLIQALTQCFALGSNESTQAHTASAALTVECGEGKCQGGQFALVGYKSVIGFSR